ncbi:hypothetical protein CPLU01_04443 [Colletotrichum plurivorum]|uniref:Uncharacterized protein n=1 Tax=Colletotrichum plurivorum TaxID=2175906 RepID=A0A8H6KPU6_9PEZI|nr:hypothetical protein CPLU01_04443 [Colletotrichum plurivorum]
MDPTPMDATRYRFRSDKGTSQGFDCRRGPESLELTIYFAYLLNCPGNAIKYQSRAPGPHHDVYRSTSLVVQELLHGSTRNMIVLNTRLWLLGLHLASIAAGQLSSFTEKATPRATTSAPWATNSEACAIADSLAISCFTAHHTYTGDDRGEQEQINCDADAPVPTFHSACHQMSNSIHSCQDPEDQVFPGEVPTAYLSCLCSQSATAGSSMYTDALETCSNWAKTARPQYLTSLQNHCTLSWGLEITGTGDVVSTGHATASSATGTDTPSPAPSGASVSPTTSPSGATGRPFDIRWAGLIAATVMVLGVFP